MGCMACSGSGPEIGANATSTFRLVGASVVVPPDTVPVQTQEMANELLGERWGNFGLHWNISDNAGQLELQPGEFPTSTDEPDSPAEWGSIGIATPGATAGELTFSGTSATYTMHFAEAGDGFTDLTVAGTLEGNDALDLVESLYDDGFSGFGETDRAEGTLPVAWTVSGNYQEVPFTAQFEQEFFVERYVYAEAD